MVVSASVDLKKIQECCNVVDNMQAHIVFFMREMRYNCVMRFSGGYRGEKDDYVRVFSGRGPKNI